MFSPPFSLPLQNILSSYKTTYISDPAAIIQQATRTTATSRNGEANSSDQIAHTMIGYLLSSKYLLVASEASNCAPGLIKNPNRQMTNKYPQTPRWSKRTRRAGMEGVRPA